MKQKIVGLSLTIVMAIIAFVMGIVTMFAPTAARAEVSSVSTADALVAAIEDTGATTVDVTLTGNITDLNKSIVISQGKTVTLDLNGYTIKTIHTDNSTTDSYYAFSNYGDFTIKCTNVNNKGSIQSRGIYNYGKLTLTSGIVEAIDANGGRAINNQAGEFVMTGGQVLAKTDDGDSATAGNYDATPLYVAKNSTATISGQYTTIENTNNFTYAIESYGSLTIFADTRVTGAHGVIAVYGGEVNVTGGTFTCTGVQGQSDHIVYVYGDPVVNIAGGTFIHKGNSYGASNGSAIYVDGDSQNATVRVEGGSFTGYTNAITGNEYTTVSGGSFANANGNTVDITDYIAPGVDIDTSTGVVSVATTVEVATYEALTASLAQDNQIAKLTENITATSSLTVDGKKAVIDLNGHTLTVTVRNFFINGANVVIKDSSVAGEGKLIITGAVAGGDALFCIGNNSTTATLTLDNIDVVGDGYNSAYAVFYVYGTSTLNINNCNITLANEQHSSGGFIKAQSAANGKVNITSSKISLTDAKIGFLDGTVRFNDVDLEITGGANAINQSALTVKNSKITISGANGRALTLAQGDIVIENSTLDFSNCTEGEIRFKKSLDLTLDSSSTLSECDVYRDSKSITATINGDEIVAVQEYNDDGSIKMGESTSVAVENGVVTTLEQPVLGFTGEGTAENPYLISNVKDLTYLAKWVNSGADYFGEDNSGYDDKYFKLVADIDLANEEWTPIGTSTNPFNGMFDGQNHTISNLSINKETTSYIGLFGFMKGGNNAGIKNLTVNNATVTGHLYVGVILGRSYTGGIIENCHVTGSVCVDGYSYIGGIVGRHEYSKGANVNGDMMAIYNCSVNANPTGTIGGDYQVTYVGGIVGFVAEGAFVIDDCSVENVEIIGTYGVGGISGIGHYGNTISGSTVEKTTVTSVNNNPESARSNNVGLIAGAVQGTDSAPTKIENSTVTETSGSVTYTDNTTKEITTLYGNNMNGSAPVTNWVAEVNGVQYEDLQTAFNNANSATVTLLRNIAIEKAIEVENTVIFDLAGYTLSFADSWVRATSDDHLIIVKRGATLTVKDSSSNGAGAIDASADASKVYGAIKLTKKGEAATGEVATLIVNGGTLKGYYYAINGNGSRDNTVIEINDGIITGRVGIYHPQNGKLTVNGGTIFGDSGIIFKSGTLEINGGIIKGTGAKGDYNYSASGASTTGAALQIENVGGNTGYEEIVSISISGGEFISVNNAAVVSYAATVTNPNAQVKTEFVTDGTFTGAEEIDNALLQSGLAFENGAVVAAAVKIVSANGVVKAYTDIDDAFDALVANDTMYIFAGTHYLNDSDEWHPRNARFDIPDSVSIYGVGDVIIQREPYFYATNLYVKNVNFEGYAYVVMRIHGSAKFVDCSFKGVNGLYQSTVENGGTIEFVDCEIIGDVYALNITGTGNVVVTNCDISGWNSISVSGTTTITGCRFVEGEDYNYLRAYNDTVIKDTNFAGAYEIDTAGTPDVEFKNVTVDGDKDKLADIISFYAKNSANVTIDGAKVEDYEINNVEELLAFADLVNKGNNFKGKTFILGNDINMDYDGVTIGTKANPFNGTFDGQNYTIQNLTINDDTADYVGLFGFTNGTIENVTVNNPHIVGRSYVAAIVGCAYTGTVENCHVTGKIDIKGNYMVGGITGHGYANIKDCSVIGAAGRDYNYIGATYLQEDLEGDNVGGIVGHKAENTTLSGCEVENVTIEGTRKIGGIVGTTFQNNKISDCSVKNITVRTNATEEYASQNSNSMALGGIIGLTAQNYTGGTVSNCAVEGVKFEVENELTTFVSAGAISGGHRVSGIATPVAPESTTFVGNEVANETITGSTVSFGAVAKVNGISYATLAEAAAKAKEGYELILTGDITVDGANVSYLSGLTVDFNGYTLYLKGGYNCTNLSKDTTFKNGTIDISGAKATAADGLFTIGERDKSGVTVTLDNMKVTGDGYASAFGVFLVYGDNTIVVKNSEINLSNEQDEGTGSIFKNQNGAGSGGNFVITNTKITAKDVARVITSGTVSLDTVELTATGGEHGINGAYLTVKNSTLNISGGTGRALTLNTPNGDTECYVVIENSQLTFANNGEGDILYKTANNITIDESSSLTAPVVNANVTDGATITLGDSAYVLNSGFAVEKQANQEIVVTGKNGAVAHVAKVTVAGATTFYASLIDAVASGATEIEIIADVNLGADTLTINSGVTVTINLNGYTVSGSSDVQNHKMIQNNGTLTLEGAGTVTYAFTGTPDTSYGKGNYTIVNSGTLTINGATVENATAAMSHMTSAIDNNSTTGNAITTINSGKVINENYIAIRQFANSTTYKNQVVVNGGEIKSRARAVYVQIPNENANETAQASLEINGGEITATGTDEWAIMVYSSGNKLNNTEVKITDGIINGSFGIYNAKAVYDFADGALEISGGTFDGVYGVYVWGAVEGFVTGGEFKYLDEQYVAEDAGMVANADGTYSVKSESALVAGNCVAKIGKMYYKSVVDAFAAATESNTEYVIELLASDNVGANTLTIAKDVKVTLNLNGYTISGSYSESKSHSMIKNDGTLTIKGAGTVTYEYTGAASTGWTWGNYTIINNGTLTIKDATIKNTTALTNHMTSAIDNHNGGDVVINNSKIVNENYIAIRQFSGGSDTNSNTVTINGGEIIAGYYGVWGQISGGKNAELTIIDGTFESKFDNSNYAVYYECGGNSAKVVVDIKDGIFNDNIRFENVNDAKVRVSDGTFNGDKGIIVEGTLSGFVTGGEFKYLDEAYIAEDAGMVANANGTYSVKDVDDIINKNYVAVIGKMYYKSVADAIAVATSGETVTLVADVANIGNVNLPAGVTFDGNDFTVSGNSSITMSATGVSKVINTNFKNISNRNNLSAIYLRPTDSAVKVISNNTFDKVDWDAIQVATADSVTATVNVEITGNTFNGTAKRYIHVEGYNETINLTISGNKMDGSATDAAIGVWYFATDSNVVLDSNYVENLANGGVSIVLGDYNEYKAANKDFSKLTNVTATYANTFVDENGAAITYQAAVVNEFEVTLYKTVANAVAAAQNGEIVSIGVAGTYALPSFTYKNITIEGAVDGVVFDNDLPERQGVNLSGSNVVFNNVTFDYYPNVNYTGLQHVNSVVYNNVTFEGQVFLYGQSEIFNNCTFEQNSSDAYNVWTYGADYVEFNNCTFNSAGKSVLVYNEGANGQELKVVKSTFNASQTVDGKAAIEIDDSLLNKTGEEGERYDIVIDQATTATGFSENTTSGSSLYNHKFNGNGVQGIDTSVTIVDENGTVVSKPITYNHAAKIGTKTYRTLQDAINAVTEGNNEIVFLKDISENVTICQKAGVNITINGNGKTYNGKMKVDGNGRQAGTDTLTIKNVNFVTTTKDLIFIDANAKWVTDGSIYNYSHNVTVKDSTFTATGDAENTAVAMKIRQGKNIVIENVTTNDLHSVLQGYGINGLTVNALTITSGKGGISTGTSTGVKISNSNINVSGYGIRAGQKDSDYTADLTISNSTITAENPVVVRFVDSEDTYSVELKGNNTFTADNTQNSQITFTSGNDGEFIAPEGNVSLSGDGAANMSVYGMVARVGDEYFNDFFLALEAVATATDKTIVIFRPVVIEENKTIDLTGITVKNSGEIVPMFRIQNNAKVTVKGGNVTNSHYVFILGASDKSSAGNLTIESGKFHGATTVASVTMGTLTIKGGEFSVDPYQGNYNYLINCIDSSYVGGIANVVITGGTFHNFDPASNAAEGANTDFVPNVYATVEENGTYKVVDAQAYIGEVGYADFFDAYHDAQAGDTIVVRAPVVIEDDMTFDFTDMTIVNEGRIVPMFRIQNDAKVTVKGGNVTNSHYVFILGASDKSSAGNLTIESGKFHGATTVASVTMGTLTINGGEFSADAYNGSYDFLINCIDESYRNETAKVVINGGTFANFDPANNKAEGANTDFVPKEYATVNTNGVFAVVEAVAYIGEVGYATLQDAIDGAQDGDTIVMLDNVNESVIIDAGKTLTIDLNGHKISSAVDTIVVNSGKLIINGNGTIESTTTGVHDVIAVTGGAEVEINGATLSGNRYVLSIYDGKATLKSGKIEARSLNGEKSSYGVYVKGSNDAQNPSVFVMEGGEIIADVGISGNGSANYTEITISGGKIDAKGVGIYHPQIGNLTITNGTITGADTGIEVRSGKVNISGGTITGNGTPVSVDPNGSGTTMVGAALGISQHLTENDINVTITGGTFNGAMAVFEVDIQNDESDNIAIDIQNGTFNGVVDSENVTEYVTAGEFAVALDASAIKQGSAMIVTANGATVGLADYIAEIAENNNYEAKAGVIYYATAEEAFEKALVGDTVVLLTNATVDSVIVIDKKITIDLNGKTITATAGAFKLANGADVVVDNGTIIAANDAFDMDVYASAGTANLKLLSDLTVKAGWNAVYIGGNATLTTEAKLYTTQVGCAVIQGNGNKAGTTIIVNGGEIVNDYDTAIYHPQNGTLTVNAGLIKGLTGIEMRNGTLVVNGGEVVATGAFSASANGNGTTVNGAAIAVSDHSTSGAPSAIINGGTFKGVYAIYETVALGGNDTANSLSVLGGTFEGDVVTKTVDGYIQGIANFKGDVDVADLHADYGFDVWPDGTLHSNLISVDLAEAHVGKYYYAKLEDAIAAAQAGQTVTLHNNATLEETLVINKNIIIRSEAGETFTVNVTLSVEGSGVELIVYNGANVTVKAEAKIGITDAVAYYSDIETAVKAANNSTAFFVVIDLLEDATVEETIVVTKDNVWFNGNGNAITSSARKVFEIGTATIGGVNASFNNLTVNATDNSQFGARAFDTRNAVTLNLSKVIINSSAVNAQPITVGGNNGGTLLYLSKTTVNAGATGYAIISFVNSHIMVVDSTLNGYTAVYMKAGSEGSLVEIGSDGLNGGKLNVASTINAESNEFGAIVSEANYVTFNVKNTEVVLGGLELAPMALVLYKAESNVANIDNVTVTGATEDYVIVGENNTTAISNSTIDAPVPFNALASTQAMFIDNNLKINVISATDAIANAKATISVGSTYALRAVANVGTYYFESLEAAVAFAKAGDAIVLAKDVTIDSAIEIDKAIAIDLNDKTITATAGAFKLADGADVVVDNGMIIAANDAFDMDVYASAGTAKLELLSDLTVKAGWNAVYIGGNATLTTKAKLYTTQAGCAVIQGNGNKAGTTIIVNGGEIVNDYDTAIYHPQNGTLTVNAGLIKGLTGIEMRNGTLVVNGGEVVATGAFSASANGNGTTVNGAAIAVSDHTTDGSANVTIKGGTFTGKYAIYETNEFGATANVMSVLDGTFYGKIYAYSVTDFIEGGLFSDNTFDEEYLVPNFMVAFDVNAQDLYQVITMDAYKAEIIAAIESKVAGMTTVNYSENGKAAIENYSTTAIDEVENATRVSAVKVIYNRVVEELASVYTAIQETVERGAITREINTYIIANGLKKVDCLANADYVAAIEGLNGAYDAYMMNTYALAAFDAIDAVATAKAEELAQAKADAIAALETADAAYNGVNITTSMFTSINTSETVEEVEDALAIALVEISEIQKYKQAINDLGTAVAKNLEEINAIDQALIELETRLNTRFDGLDTAISNAKTVLDRVDTNVQTILEQQLTQNELDKLYEDLCDKIDTADDAILKYLEETVLVAVQQNGTAIGALTDKVIELDGLLNDKLDTTFATIIDDYLKVIDTNVDSILDAVKVGGTLDTQIKGAITTITSAISSSEAEILRVIREEIPVMISNQNTTIQGYINTLKDILEGRFDNVDSDLERIEGKIDTVDGIVDELKAYLTTDGAGLDAKLDEMLTAVLEGQAKVVTDIAKILREEVIAAITTQTANVKTAINEAKDAIVGSASDPNTVLTLGNLFAKVEATIQQVQKSEGNITDMLHNTNESGLLDELNGKLDDIIADQSTLRGDIETIINTALTDMLTASDLTGIVNDLSSIKTTLGDANSGMVQKLETILTAVNNTTSAEEIAQKVKQELGDGSSLTAITGVLNTVKDTASSNNNLLNQIVSWMNDGGALKTMLDAIAGDAQKAATQAEAAYNEVAKLGLGTAQDLIAKLQKAVEDAEKAAKDAEGAVDGLTGAVNDVKTAAEAAELAAKAAEAAAKAAEAAAKKVQDATITAKAAAAIEDIESWISEYLDGLNAQTLKAVTYSTVTEEFRTELEGKLEKAYSEENRALILNYYDQAVASLKVASTEAEIDYAVKTFKANVALVDVLDTLTPIVPEKEDNSSIVAILVVIVVFVVVIAGAVVVGFVFILKLRKSVSNDTDPTDDEPTKKIEEKEETQTVEPVEEIEQVTEEAEQSASTETAEEVETATEEVVETAEEPAIEEVEEVEEVEETEDDNDDDDDNDDNDGAETEVVATEVVEENSEVDAFASLNKRSKTFEERMREADEQTKNNYEEIKDEFLSYKKVKSRVSKKCDSFRIGRKLLAKIIVRGKSLKCFLALDPNAYEITVFHHRDSSEKRAYAEVPMTMRVRSPRSVKNVKRLIGELANQNELIKK